MAGEISASLLSQGGLTPDPETSRSPGGRPAPTVRAASLQSASLSVEHTVETLDRVEIRGALGSSQQAGESGIALNSDGTYSLSALSARRETLRIDAQFTRAEFVEVDGGNNRLQGVLEDVRDGFRSVLQNLRDSIVRNPDAPRGTRLQLPGLRSQGILNGQGLGLGDQRKLAGYLEMLRTFSQQYGSNPALDKAIASLEQYLDGDGSAESISAASIETYQISIEIEYTEVTQLNVRFGGEEAQLQQADPIVIDLDGDGLEVSSAANGVNFDITGDGVPEQTAFPTGGDGFLVFDRNGNGIIDSGRELFGDHHGAANGFEELAKFDSNIDGLIDGSDPIFNQLKVFVDENFDGESQLDELYSLNRAGIRSLLLNYNKANGQVNGNKVPEVSSVLTGDGITRTAADVLLNYIG